MREASDDVSILLRRWSEGDSQAFDQLIPLVTTACDRSRTQRLRNEPGVSVNTTALADEAYLEFVDASAARVGMLEQRYFGGLSLEETAAALDVSLATVERELRSARAWLATQPKPGMA